MTHHVDRDHGVEARVGEGKRAAGVRPHEADTVGEAALLGEPRRCGDALLEQVDPDDARTRPLGQAQSRAAGAAAHVEEARLGAVQP
ncbi:MAG TPA: hypothetical protein VJ716_00640 [Gaiellaceae bacterium]|nr:hypothetical protein [Gaiellaceae bacterium]